MELPAATLARASLQLPQGTYTTLRTYEGDKFLRLEAHLSRLEESGCLLGYPVSLDRSRIRRALRDVLSRTGFPESRLRLTVPFASDPAGGEVYISVEPFKGLDPALYNRGVHTITMATARLNPQAKATAFIAPSRQLYRSLPQGVHEVLITNPRGEILEGFTSNFFAVKEGVLHTAGEGVLEGITRSIVMEEAAQTLPICLEPVRLADLPHLSEAFITSNSREVVPVISVDRIIIGRRQPGPIARELLERYRQRIRQEIAPL